jgi:sporulation protein YlmC with PRC-barrel domain
MDLLDEGQQRWYCHKDDELYFAKENVWNPEWNGYGWILKPARVEQELASRPLYRREDLVSKQVYELSGRLIGSIRDVGCSQDGHTTLLLDRHGQEVWIAFSEVAAVGDIVLVKKRSALTDKDGTVVF